jgi:hypothetical protein
MLWTALEDPDPVLIFEHGTLYNMEGEMAADAGPVEIAKAAVRRFGTDVSLITTAVRCSKPCRPPSNSPHRASTRKSWTFARCDRSIPKRFSTR